MLFTKISNNFRSINFEYFLLQFVAEKENKLNLNFASSGKMNGWFTVVDDFFFNIFFIFINGQAAFLSGEKNSTFIVDEKNSASFEVAFQKYWKIFSLKGIHFIPSNEVVQFWYYTVLLHSFLVSSFFLNFNYKFWSLIKNFDCKSIIKVIIRDGKKNSIFSCHLFYLFSIKICN